jgi:hypothetical protein
VFTEPQRSFHSTCAMEPQRSFHSTCATEPQRSFHSTCAMEPWCSSIHVTKCYGASALTIHVKGHRTHSFHIFRVTAPIAIPVPRGHCTCCNSCYGSTHPFTLFVTTYMEQEINVLFVYTNWSSKGIK